MREVITPSMPAVKSFIVGGDFNTNPDQVDFAEEKTLNTLSAAGFRSSVGASPCPSASPIPGAARYPDATFDYLFASNLQAGETVDHRLPRLRPLSTNLRFLSGGGTMAQTTTPPASSPRPTRLPATTTAPAPSQPSAAQFVTLTQPVKIKIPYGETVLPRGLTTPHRLPRCPNGDRDLSRRAPGYPDHRDRLTVSPRKENLFTVVAIPLRIATRKVRRASLTKPPHSLPARQ